MNYLSRNLKFLRKKRSVTQEEMAHALDLKKSTYASYEMEDGNVPPARTLYTIAKYFEVSMESLFDINFTVLRDHQLLKVSDQEIYFPVSVDLSGSELVDVVPSDHRAQAGYVQDYSDPSFIQALPKISWDLGIYESGTKRIFQITGDSMLPIPSGSFVLGLKQDYEDLVNDQAYIVVTQHDILFKRIRKDETSLHLISDNTLFPPQRIEVNDVRQYWKALKVIMDMPAMAQVSLHDLNETLVATRNKVDEVLQAVKG